MGKSTLSMAIFNSFLYVYQRVGKKQIYHVEVEFDTTESIRFIRWY